MSAIGLALAAAAGWLAKDLTSRLLDRAVARAGRVGYAPRDCGFFGEAELEDGRKVLSRYDPNNMFKEVPVHHLRCSGDLYNDSDLSLLLTKPSVAFWSSSGPLIRHQNPRLFVGAEEPTVVTVPAHGRAPVVITVPIFREDLDSKYAGTLPVLQMTDVQGKEHQFRLSSTSFYGQLAAWPRKGQLPIVLLDRSRRIAATDEPRMLKAALQSRDAVVVAPKAADDDH